jgi:DNA-binding response OmpR family regulator
MICEHCDVEWNQQMEWLLASRPMPKPRTRDVVLVIDGDALSRKLTGRYLNSLGWEAMLAADGAAGLAIFRTAADTIAAVVLEYHLPDSDGARVLRELRRLRPNVPVVVCASHAADEVARRIPDDGVLDCLSKPFSCGQLELAVRMAGRRRRSASKPDA